MASGSNNRGELYASTMPKEQRSKKISLGTSTHRKDNRREVRSSVQAQTNNRNTARVHQQATHDNATKRQASSRKDSKQPTLKAFFDKQANPQVKLKSQENHCQPAQPTSCHHETIRTNGPIRLSWHRCRSSGPNSRANHRFRYDSSRGGQWKKQLWSRGHASSWYTRGQAKSSNHPRLYN